MNENPCIRASDVMAAFYGTVENIRSTPGLRVELSCTGGIFNVSVTDCGRWEHTAAARNTTEALNRMLEMTTSHRKAWEAKYPSSSGASPTSVRPHA